MYDLNSLRFIEKKENIFFYGNSGVGKTHLATAIGMTAAQNCNSTYFIKCSDLMDTLRKAQLEGRLTERLKKFSGYKLLIIDELGYLPISKEDSKLFFQLIDKRYERNSTIITTNINFSQWDEIFGDPMIAGAIVDRLLHHATVLTIKGKSYKLQALYNDDES
ncbi:IS21-like element helper ATPase IstB [Mogibacterium pumilum]